MIHIKKSIYFNLNKLLYIKILYNYSEYFMFI